VDFLRLLQLGVLRLGFFEDGDIGVGVFPESEEILIGGERPDTSGIGVRALRGSRLQRIRASYAQMRQRSRPAVPNDTAVVENLLKLGGGSAVLLGCSNGEGATAPSTCLSLPDLRVPLKSCRRA
jgi:hypothetical protein